jgi:4-hydroxybenzoate polyprenyltransferase
VSPIVEAIDPSRLQLSGPAPSAKPPPAPGPVALLAHLLRVSRPAGWLIALGIYRVGMAYAEARESARAWLIAAALTFPFGLVLFGWNDLADAASDRANPRKGTWLHGARVDASNAGPTRLAVRSAAALLLAGAVVLALRAQSAPGLGSDRGSAALLAASVVLAWAYSARPLRLKEVPIVDGVCSAASISALLALGWLQGQTELQVPPEPVAYVPAIVGLHTFATVMDRDSDRSAKHRTLAVRIGARATAGIALGLTLLTVAAIPFVELAPVIAAVAVFQAAVMAAHVAVPRRLGARAAFVIIGLGSAGGLAWLVFVYLAP